MNNIVLAMVGGRDFYNLEASLKLFDKMSARYKICRIVSGGATGADHIAEMVAALRHIPIIRYLPNWKKHGRAAGPIRNELIVENSDIVIAFWDGVSKGTKSTIDISIKMRKLIYVIRYQKHERYCDKMRKIFLERKEILF